MRVGSSLLLHWYIQVIFFSKVRCFRWIGSSFLADFSGDLIILIV